MCAARSCAWPCPPSSSPSEAVDQLHDQHLTYRVRDRGNVRHSNGEIGNRYGISGLPTTFVLNSAGQITATLCGPQTVRSFLTALD